MEWHAGRGHFTCTYCATYAFVQALEASPDGVQPVGRDGEHHCPECRALLSLGLIEGRTVEQCGTCRGLLVTNDDFLVIVNMRRAKRTEPPVKPAPLDPREMQRRVDCPRCAKAMEVHPYYGPGNVVIDSCAGCGLIWLNHGELAAIERAPGRRW